MLAAAAILAPTASAAPPKLASAKIVLNKSIGGIAIGSPARPVQKLFPAGSCSQDPAAAGPSCFFSGLDVDFVSGVVEAISLGGAKYMGPPTTYSKRFRTDKGIGTGSAYAAVKRAYPASFYFASGGALSKPLHQPSQTELVFKNGKLESMQILYCQLKQVDLCIGD